MGGTRNILNDNQGLSLAITNRFWNHKCERLQSNFLCSCPLWVIIDLCLLHEFLDVFHCFYNCTSNAILLPNNKGTCSLQQNFCNLIKGPNVKESLFSTQWDFEPLRIWTYVFHQPTSQTYILSCFQVGLCLSIHYNKPTKRKGWSKI